MADKKKYEISTSELKKYICLAMKEVMPKGIIARRGRKIRRICSRYGNQN